MHGTKEDRKGSSSWLDLCNNGDYSIPPTGLEFHNTQLLPTPGSQKPGAPVSPRVPPNPKEQEVMNKPRLNETVKCKNNPISSITNFPAHNIPPVVDSQGSKGHKRLPTHNDGVGNPSLHCYNAGPHYSQLAAAASSNYNRDSRYYCQHHHQ